MKETGIAYALWLFLGLFGAHRFYLGLWFSGFLQFITLGGLFVWWAIDLVQMPFLVKYANKLAAKKQAKFESAVAEAKVRGLL